MRWRFFRQETASSEVATIFSDKKEGGLEVRGLYNLNKALLSKWLWRLVNEKYSLWRKVISSKFGEDPWVGALARCKEPMEQCLERD